jgi:hypothetical protein
LLLCRVIYRRLDFWLRMRNINVLDIDQKNSSSLYLFFLDTLAVWNICLNWMPVKNDVDLFGLSSLHYTVKRIKISSVSLLIRHKGISRFNI